MVVYVQPSDLRVFPDDAYRQAGAVLTEDISGCPVILGIKEIPLHHFEEGKTYLFFSHTIKGQPYNMPILRCMMEKGCRLIDYEKITDDQGRRLVLFGRHAGLAGMMESLHAVGARLAAEGLSDSQNPFGTLKHAYQYKDLQEARESLHEIGRKIVSNGLPEVISPLVVGFLGYGNVSRGAQELLDSLPVEQLSPHDLLARNRSALSRKTLFKVVFEEKDTVEAIGGTGFSLEDYLKNPERYGAVFSKFLPHLSILINGVYWDERFPVIVGAEDLRALYSSAEPPSLRVIGDITCDIEGSIEVTRKSTPPEAPCYVYDTRADTIEDGVSNLNGPVIMAVDNLPTEFPVESSSAFGDALIPFLPAIAANDFSENTGAIPGPIRRAIILDGGKLTKSFRYLEKHL
jgi:alpha-aminoadipic semialdehyde synthase